MIRNLAINRWDNKDASKFAALLDQRVYTSRLLGADPTLVLHGGGNTSVKVEVANLFGQLEKAIFVKGSGWDLATITEAGFSGLFLEHLYRLRTLGELNDTMLMNALRRSLIDPDAPNPSVETLLHAFLPHRFIDHTHADAILTLTNQPDGEAIIRRIFGNRVGIVPYRMPGFELAKLCIDTFEKNPDTEGLILMHHGIFTFADTAKESYDKMLHFVNVAEEYIHCKVPRVQAEKETPVDMELVRHWMHHIRKTLWHMGFSCVAKFDASASARELVNHKSAATLSQKGVLTPNHAMHTKPWPLFLDKNITVERDVSRFDSTLRAFMADYEAYYKRNAEVSKQALKMLDAFPRVFVLAGLGIITIGKTQKDAAIAMDIALHTAECLVKAEAMSSYLPLPEQDVFHVEYWVLEQAKKKLAPKALPLTSKIACVTGGCSGIGLAIAGELLSQGACVFVIDRNEKAFADAEKKLAPLQENGAQENGTQENGTLSFIKTDIADHKSHEESINTIIETMGGIDIVVVNAGILPATSAIENITLKDWQNSLDVNTTGAFNTISQSLKWLKAQGHGGDIVVIASKNVLAPGKGAASYSVAKAAQTQLARVAALEAGGHGIRVNVVHPHLVFDTALWTDAILAERAKAYGMSVEEYKTNNLLKTTITSDDVAKAVFALVGGYFSKTTGVQIPIDGGSDRTL